MIPLTQKLFPTMKRKITPPAPLESQWVYYPTSQVRSYAHDQLFKKDELCRVDAVVFFFFIFILLGFLLKKK